MRAAVILAFFLATVLNAIAGAKPNLEESRKQFEQIDARLNKAYKSVSAELGADQMAALRELQRDWVKYRDRKTESLLWFNGIKTEPKKTADYWDNLKLLTEERIEFLRVYSGAAVRKGIPGEYHDFVDGDLSLKETKKGIEFSITVVRGPSAHTGEISGVAIRNGDKAVYKEAVPQGENREPCEITFTFIDGHIVKVDGKNTGYYHGARAYFDGIYYKTKPNETQGSRSPTGTSHPASVRRSCCL